MIRTSLFLTTFSIFTLLADQNSTSKRAEQIENAQISPTYLLGASPKVSESGYNPFLEVSFLYYNLQQEGLDLASTGTFGLGTNLSYTTSFTNPQFLLKQPNKFNPGFKILLGYSFDTWDLYSEFSRITSHTHVKKFAPSSIPGSAVFITQTAFQVPNSQGINPCGPEIESDWKIKVYTLDLLTRRESYLSRHLVISPYFGLQALWIYQHFNLHLTEQANSVAVLPTAPISSLNESKFWSIGPKLGLTPKVLLPKNFSIYSDISWSLGYGEYDIYHKETAVSLNQTPDFLTYNFNNIEYLRNVFQISLGAGWESYFSDDKYHTSLNIGYDFFLYPEQNMIKRSLEHMTNLTSTAAESLYIHGLNINANFKF